MLPVAAVPVWLTTSVLAGPHSWTTHLGFVQSCHVGTAPTHVASAIFRERSPTISVVLEPSVMSRRPLRLLR